MTRATLLLLALAGCDDQLFGPDYPFASGDGPDYASDWDGVQAFSADYCDACHPALYDALTLPDDLKAAANDDADSLVIPGDPEGSRVWQAVAGTNPELVLMPQGATEPLEDTITSALYDWIAQGAVVP